MERGLIPGAEPPGFVDRMSDFALSRQFKVMGGNLDKYGIPDWLSERDPRGKEAWGGFVAITDEVIGAKVVENPDDLPMATTTQLTFDTQIGRKDFTELLHKLQAGITPGLQMPFCEYGRGWKPRLVIERFTYPDLSTIGRLGTILLRRRYSDVEDINVLSQTPVNQLNLPQGLPELPDSLAERIKDQLKLVNGISPVSSGRLALIGKVMRDELEPRLPEGKRLPVQRPWDDRSHVEERAAFFPTKGPVPLSSSSVGRMVAAQLRERAQDITGPYRKRNVTKAVEDFVDMATGLGLLQGISVTGRALATLVAAFGVATWGTVRDIGHRRKS